MDIYNDDYMNDTITLHLKDGRVWAFVWDLERSTWVYYGRQHRYELAITMSLVISIIVVYGGARHDGYRLGGFAAKNLCDPDYAVLPNGDEYKFKRSLSIPSNDLYNGEYREMSET